MAVEVSWLQLKWRWVRRTEKSHENLLLNTQSPNRYSNTVPPEQKSEVLIVEANFSVIKFQLEGQTSKGAEHKKR